VYASDRFEKKTLKSSHLLNSGLNYPDLNWSCQWVDSVDRYTNTTDRGGRGGAVANCLCAGQHNSTYFETEPLFITPDKPDKVVHSIANSLLPK